jgi:hypothetical protein
MDGLRRAIGIGVLVSGSLTIAGSAQAVEPTPTLKGKGLVRTSGDADFAPAADGTALASGAGVQAPSDRQVAIRVGPGVFIHLAPSSEVMVRPALWLPAERPGASPVRALQVILTSGEIDLESHAPGGDLGLQVMLPGGRSVALWRGDANVALSGDTVTSALYDGMAIAGTAAGKWKPLTPGNGVVLAAKANPVGKVSPGVATWADAASSGAPPFALVRGDERATLGAAWSAVQGAASYRVEFAPTADFSGPVLTSSTENPSFKTEALGPGSYYLRVRSISADGLEGPLSTPKALRVAKLTIPPLATATAQGAIVIAGTQAVTLDDPRDIEVATASEFDPTAAPRWVPATEELSLGSATRRVLRIRHIPSQVESSLILVRRQLRAHISFTPAQAHWPDNPVDIIVKVDDPSGYIDAAHEPLTIDAQVDLDRLALNWAHNGDTWTARVPPRAPPGPWVVRVNVQDKTGVGIGASLIDIDDAHGRTASRTSTSSVEVDR